MSDDQINALVDGLLAEWQAWYTTMRVSHRTAVHDELSDAFVRGLLGTVKVLHPDLAEGAPSREYLLISIRLWRRCFNAKSEIGPPEIVIS